MRILPLVLLLLLAGQTFAADTVSRIDFVGRQHCASCHAAQEKAWQGSHHDLAMQHATATTVLGDFNNRDFSHAGIAMPALAVVFSKKMAVSLHVPTGPTAS